ncbi:MAG: response regulator [Acidimicrobiales bacterium]
MTNEILPTPASRVVLVDARDDRRQLMRNVVGGDDAKSLLVGEADSSAAALAVVSEQQADVVILDVQMPLSEGLVTIAALRQSHPHLGIIVCSFDLDQATVQRVLDQGADMCLAKPVGRMDVLAALGRLRDDRQGAGQQPDGVLTAAGATATSG